MLNGPPEGHGLEEWRGDGKHFILLRHIEGRLADGQPVWRTLAKLDLPPLGDDEEIFYGVLNQCTLRGVGDWEILALAKRCAPEPLGPVLRAWRANRLLGRFDEVPATVVWCYQYVVD